MWSAYWIGNWNLATLRWTGWLGEGMESWQPNMFPLKVDVFLNRFFIFHPSELRKFLLLENVTGLLSPKLRPTMDYIVEAWRVECRVWPSDFPPASSAASAARHAMQETSSCAFAQSTGTKSERQLESQGWWKTWVGLREYHDWKTGLAGAGFHADHPAQIWLLQGLFCKKYSKVLWLFQLFIIQPNMFYLNANSPGSADAFNCWTEGTSNQTMDV